MVSKQGFDLHRHYYINICGWINCPCVDQPEHKSLFLLFQHWNWLDERAEQKNPFFLFHLKQAAEYAAFPPIVDHPTICSYVPIPRTLLQLHGGGFNAWPLCRSERPIRIYIEIIDSFQSTMPALLCGFPQQWKVKADKHTSLQIKESVRQRRR